MVEHLPFTLKVWGSIPTWANIKKEKRVHMSQRPHKSSVQSGALQSRVWMVHFIAVLYCASGDDWGSRWMYPDPCGLPTKFHTSSTEQNPPTHLHCIHYNTSQEVWLHCVSTCHATTRKKVGGHGLVAAEHTVVPAI